MNRFSIVQWVRRHPFAADSALGVALAIAAIAAQFGRHSQSDAPDPTALSMLLAAAASLPLAARRVHPFVVLAIVAPAQVVLELMGYDGPGWLGLFIALYTVAAHTSGRPRAVAAKVFAAGGTIVLTLGLVFGHLPIGSFISTIVFLIGAFILGDNLQRRRRAAADLAEQHEREERERELITRQHAQDERSRIARELHDVVAHSVSLMIIQAGAARRSIATSPTQAETALRELESTGRYAMDELRRVLGVLRTGDGIDDHELAPQPSLDTVRELIDSDPTLPVELVESGVPPEEMPSSIGLSLYRVVQEALTNVRKHAGSVKRVVVKVTYEPERVVVQITDDGRGASVRANVDGHGLVGMRERMALCGGTVTAGPRPGGGWQVRASAPLERAYS